MLIDFLAKFGLPIGEETTYTWILSIDDTSNLKGSGTGIVLEEPYDLLIKNTLKFELKTTNNQAEYESFITDMRTLGNIKRRKPELSNI